MNYKNLTKFIVFSLSLSFFSTFLKAENLEEVYELALKNDPLLKAAEASYRAGKENKVQGRSGLLPNLSVSGSTNWNEYRVMDQIIDQYNSNNYSGRLSQPLFRMDKWFQFKRGKALSESAGAEFAYQQQETMIRVASAYFNVLNSIDSLNAARAEEKAIGRQKDLAKKRFEVGLAAITEVQETQAAYDLTIVSRISREAQLDSAKEGLTSIVGKFTVIGLAWSFSFQILSEIRHLLMDMGYGFELQTTRISGLIVIFGSILLTILIYLIGRNFI